MHHQKSVNAPCGFADLNKYGRVLTYTLKAAAILFKSLYTPLMSTKPEGPTSEQAGNCPT